MTVQTDSSDGRMSDRDESDWALIVWQFDIVFHSLGVHLQKTLEEGHWNAY